MREIKNLEITPEEIEVGKWQEHIATLINHSPFDSRPIECAIADRMVELTKLKGKPVMTQPEQNELQRLRDRVEELESAITNGYWRSVLYNSWRSSDNAKRGMFATKEEAIEAANYAYEREHSPDSTLEISAEYVFNLGNEELLTLAMERK